MSSPESTVLTARAALEERNWDQLYRTTVPHWRKRYIPGFRSRLRSLLKHFNPPQQVTPESLDKLDRKQVFRTFLESFSRSERWQKVLKRYESVDYDITRIDDTTARVNLKSRFPLPYRTTTLKKTPDGWKIYDMSR
ncbi:MAG: hypothetical protein ABEK50_00515 [bacterium]